MGNPQQDNRIPVAEQMRRWFNLATYAGPCMAKPMLLPLRELGSPGVRDVGFLTVAGGGIQFLTIASYEPSVAAVYFYTISAAVIVQAVAIRMNPEVRHSLYSGYPIICKLWRRFTGNTLDELTVKSVWEPLLLAALGTAVIDTTKGLGICLYLAAAGQAFSCMVGKLERASALRSMQDARIEYQQLTRSHNPRAGRRR